MKETGRYPMTGGLPRSLNGKNTQEIVISVISTFASLGVILFLAISILLRSLREIEVKCNKPPMRKLAMGFAHMRDFDLAIDWAFGSVSDDERRRYRRTMKSESFKKMVNEEMQKLLEDHELTKDYTMDLLKESIEVAKEKKDVSNMLKAVDNLQDLHGMKDKGQIVTTNTLEASMTRKMLDEIDAEEKRLKLREVKVEGKKEG